MKPGKYIGRVTSSDEHWNPLSCAILELTQEDINTLEARWNLLKELRKEDKALDEMVYTDLSLVFYDEDLDVEEIITDAASFAGYQDNEEWLLLETEPNEEETAALEAHVARTECDKMFIDDHFIRWECYPRHTDITCCTVLLAFADLFKEKL